MEIIRVTREQERERFIALPRKIYQNDANWTPQFDFQVREKLDLDSINTNNWNLLGCCATSGEGVYEGLDWLIPRLK